MFGKPVWKQLLEIVWKQLLEIEIICNIIHVFIVTFGQFNASLLNKRIHFLRNPYQPHQNTLHWWWCTLDRRKHQSFSSEHLFYVFFFLMCAERHPGYLHTHPFWGEIWTWRAPRATERLRGLAFSQTHSTAEGWTRQRREKQGLFSSFLHLCFVSVMATLLTWL